MRPLAVHSSDPAAVRTVYTDSECSSSGIYAKRSRTGVSTALGFGRPQRSLAILWRRLFQILIIPHSKSVFLPLENRQVGECWLWPTARVARIFESSVRGESRAARGSSMKKPVSRRNHDGMRSEYDFASMKGGVRGKHYRDYRNGTNVVLLQPDVAAAFPTEDAVNEALRGVLTTTRAVRRSGGLPDRAVGVDSERSPNPTAANNWLVHRLVARDSCLD
jgi:hypothetical protein